MLTPEETLRVAQKLEAQGIDAAEQGRQRQLLGNKLWEFAMREFLLRDEPADAGVMGMTLRDYFAGKALVGCFNFWVQVNARTVIGDPNPQAITKLAYEYADEMLKARAK